MDLTNKNMRSLKFYYHRAVVFGIFIGITVMFYLAAWVISLLAWHVGNLSLWWLVKNINNGQGPWVKFALPWSENMTLVVVQYYRAARGLHYASVRPSHGGAVLFSFYFQWAAKKIWCWWLCLHCKEEQQPEQAELSRFPCNTPE